MTRAGSTTELELVHIQRSTTLLVIHIATLVDRLTFTQHRYVTYLTVKSLYSVVITRKTRVLAPTSSGSHDVE